jgi:polyvinyl alcohol dehydrogenase (cytochrome)
MRIARAAAALLLIATVASTAPAGAVPKKSRVRVPGCAPAVHPGGDWPSYGHDLSNTRHQQKETTIGLTEAPLLAPAWSFSSVDADGGGDFTSTPVVADGCVFIGSNEGWVYAMNADTGEPVWKTKLQGSAPGDGRGGGAINSSLAVSGGRVYVGVSRISNPYLAALSETTGKVLWTRDVDNQPGSDLYGSPVLFEGLVFMGWSAGSAELGDEADRYRFQGGFILADAKTGRLVKKTYTIRPPDKDVTNPKDDFAGGAIWSTPAIDPVTRYAYVGAGNPFRPQAEHDHTNAILKIDLDRRRKTFGRIVDSYKGTVDEYVPGFSELPCFDVPGNPSFGSYPQGLGSCGDIDLDFGAAPNLFKDSTGRLLVGEGQKSGIYHAVDAKTMDGVWTALVGPPSQVGGIVGSTAYDGDAVYGPITVAGYLWSVSSENGVPRWASPVADGAHWGNPVTTANGIVYTVDLRGFLLAYEAGTGVPLLQRPIFLDGPSPPTSSWGGVSVARNTVYAAVGITGLPTGYVVAFRPGGGGDGGGGGGLPLPKLPTGPTIISGAGGASYGYLTPAMIAQPGGELTYLNLDAVKHDVVHDARADGVYGPSNQPWCPRFQKGQCPVFWSEQIGLGESAPVLGLDNLEGGTAYTFYCTIHPNMSGTVVAL